MEERVRVDGGTRQGSREKEVLKGRNVEEEELDPELLLVLVLVFVL